MNNKYRILISSGMRNPIKVKYKLKPLLKNQKIESIYLIRQGYLDHSKVKTWKAFNTKYTLLYEIYRLLFITYVLLFKKINIIIGISFLPHGLIAGIFGILFRIKTIQVLIGSDFHYLKRSSLLIWILKRADHIITRGNKTINDVHNLGYDLKKLTYIPNYFDFSFLSPKNIYDYKKSYDLIYVGNIVRIKRLDILVEAVAYFKNRNPNNEIKCCIVGDGPLSDDIKELSKKMGLYDNFDFVGKKSNVFNYYYRSRIFIMTSENEGLPNAMLEALACGLPVIMPNVSNIPLIAKHGFNSMLVAPLNIKEFAEAIELLINDQNYYKKLEQGAKRFKEQYKYELSLDNIIKIWNNVFERINN